jgi:LysM repeat protein
MSLKVRLGIAALLLTSLAGCYRPASDSLEPLTNPTAAPTKPGGNGGSNNTNPSTDLTAFPATETLPPVTVIQSTPLPIDTTAPLDTTVIPSSQTNGTPPVTILSPLTQQPLEQPSATAQFITPNVPIGPVEFDTVTPLPALSPTTTPSGLITPTELSTGEGAPCTYTVKSGDNLFRIALKNNVSVDELKSANSLPGDLIQPGQVLQIPGCVPNATPTQVTSGGATTGNATPNAAGETLHTVAAGETLLAIARQYGVTVDAIVQANHLTDPNRLSVGQQLIIPSKQ